MRNIICIGASAGGVEALQSVVAGFPADHEATVFVVLHIPSYQQSRLAEILRAAGPLPSPMASDGERFSNGHIYVAPPDHHLLLERRKLAVIKGPKENRCRPAIDPLFRSAAQFDPERGVGVLLSGLLDDGTAGMGALLAKLARTRDVKKKGSPAVVTLTRIENEYAKLREVPRAELEALGTPSSLICPGCNGPLWQLKEGPRRFRCHTGHSYTPNSLIDEHRELAEKTLGVLMTLFDDEVVLSRHILETNKNPDQVEQMKRDLRESEERAALLRKLLPGGFRQSLKKARKK